MQENGVCGPPGLDFEIALSNQLHDDVHTKAEIELSSTEGIAQQWRYKMLPDQCPVARLLDGSRTNHPSAREIYPNENRETRKDDSRTSQFEQSIQYVLLVCLDAMRARLEWCWLFAGKGNTSCPLVAMLLLAQMALIVMLTEAVSFVGKQRITSLVRVLYAVYLSRLNLGAYTGELAAFFCRSFNTTQEAKGPAQTGATDQSRFASDQLPRPVCSVGKVETQAGQGGSRIGNAQYACFPYDPSGSS